MKILYVSTILGTIHAFLIPHIDMLINNGHEVEVAANSSNAVYYDKLSSKYTIHDIEFSRNISYKNLRKAFNQLTKLISEGDYDIVHTHTPVASAIARLACKNIEETKVFYTAHGFHFYEGAPIKNWLIYYPLEKWLAKYTDTLITINKEDYERAKSKFKAKRVEYIPGVGLDVDKFRNVVVDKAVKREEIGVPQNSFVILSVGELNKNKNHEVIIRAIAKLNNPKVHFIICGRGPLKSYLKKLSIELGISDNVHLLGFRKDIPELCKISDVFAFPSLREGLPVSLMEAMASGLPVICSAIRGNTDLIDNQGGGLFDPHSVDSCKNAISETLKNDLNAIGKYNTEKVKCFSYDAVKEAISRLYKEV